MKNTIVMIILLLLLMGGCSANAMPSDVTTEPSAATTEPSTVPSPSEESSMPSTEPIATETFVEHDFMAGFTDTVVVWEENDYLSLLPNPGADLEWVAYSKTFAETEFHVVSKDWTDKEARAYIEELQNLGFTMDAQLNSSVDRYGLEDISFYAHDADYTYISIQAVNQLPDGEPGLWLSHIRICTAPDETPPADAVAAAEAWASDAIRATVPEPPTVYWQNVLNGNQQIDGSTRIELQYITLPQTILYAQQLFDAGFNLHVGEHIVFGGYQFIAQDIHGNVVNLRYNAAMENELRTQVDIIPAELLTQGMWNYSFYSNEYIPEPQQAQNWTVHRTHEQLEIRMPEMTYRDALAYLEEAKAFVKKQRNMLEIIEYEQDDANETLSLLMEVIKRKHGGLWRIAYWNLIYDPNDPECPCKLVS